MHACMKDTDTDAHRDTDTDTDAHTDTDTDTDAHRDTDTETETDAIAPNEQFNTPLN